MVTLDEMCWLTVGEESKRRDDSVGSDNEAKSPVDYPARPSKTLSLQTSQVSQPLELNFEGPDLETELNTFKFCIGLPFKHPPRNMSQTCCLCEEEYCPQWCIRGPETSVMLPCGCLLGHLCAHRWFSKCEMGKQNCPNCNTLVVDGYGNPIRVDKPERWTDDGESIELSTTKDQPNAGEAIDLAVPANQQDSHAALPWADPVTSEEVDKAVHRRLRHTSDQQKSGVINEENEFAWLSLADPAGHRPIDQDDDEFGRGRSRHSSAYGAAASDAVTPSSNEKLVHHRSSKKAGSTKAIRGLAKAVSAVNLLMRPY